jgi:hypothetical protein
LVLRDNNIIFSIREMQNNDKSYFNKHIQNEELGWDAIAVPQYKIYPKHGTNSGKVGAIRTYTTAFKH